MRRNVPLYEALAEARETYIRKRQQGAVDHANRQ